MIKTLFFFENGNVAACDESGQQVADEQFPAHVAVVHDKLRRGLITRATLIEFQSPRRAASVGEILESYPLR